MERPDRIAPCQALVNVPGYVKALKIAAPTNGLVKLEKFVI